MDHLIMSYATTYTSRLPDPEFKPEFYADTISKRLIAWIIDTILILILCLVIIPFTAFTALFFLPFLYFVVGFIYRVATISNFSATPGMLMMSIEFRTHNAEKFDTSHAFFHTLGFTLTSSTILPQLISIGLMFVTPRGQGLTDLVLGTVAINKAA